MKKLFLSLVFLLPFTTLWADVSPRPEMEFLFIHRTAEEKAINPIRSEQIQCTDNQCLESKPLGHYGIQKLYCTTESCFSVAYEYTDFQKLIIVFSDGTTRESNIFPTTHKLRARYKVYVDKDTLTVEPTNVVPDLGAWARTDAIFSLILVLILELVAAMAYLIYTQKSFTILYSVAVANVVTMGISWLLLAWYASDTTFLWVFYVIAEALIIRLMNLKKLSLKDSFTLSLTMNVTSYSLGIILSFIVADLLF